MKSSFDNDIVIEHDIQSCDALPTFESHYSLAETNSGQLSILSPYPIRLVVVVGKALINIIKCYFLGLLTSLLVTYSALLVNHTAQKRKSLCAMRTFYISRKGGKGGGGWGHPQGDMHMVAARLGCQSAMVGTGWPILALAAWAGLENATLTL